MYNIIMIQNNNKKILDTAYSESEAWDLCFDYANKYSGAKILIEMVLN